MTDRPTTPPDPTRPALQATPLAPEPTEAPPGASAAKPYDPSLEPLVAQARADLAARLGVAPEAISVVEARSVVWPDGGLGCPAPGVLYPQVQVDGLLIRLAVDGATYAYHSGGGRGPFLCEHKPGGDTLAPPPGFNQ
jgi:hypothetical protein